MNTLKQKVNDVFVVLRALWFILLFLALGFIAFFMVEQGQDMMFSILDDLLEDYKIQSYLLSLIALVVWGVQTSFGARILVMFSDLSFYPRIPDELSDADKEKMKASIDETVRRRQKLSSQVPRMLYWAPFIIVTASYIKAAFTYHSDHNAWLALAVVVATNMAVAFVTYRIAFRLYHKHYKINHDASTANALRTLNRVNSLAVLGNIRTIFIAGVVSAIALIIIYSLLPTAAYRSLGAVHIICMSFGCWIAFFYWVDYIDKHKTVFLKAILFAYVCLVSYKNLDHPLRLNSEEVYCKPQHDVVTHFNQWVAQHTSPGDTLSPLPVIFISAEGGACRSAYWVSMVLSKLQETCPEFRDHIFSYSSVSGGTIGVNFFNQLNMFSQKNHVGLNYIQKTETFYEQDFLAPLTGRMMFGEVINVFSPRMVEKFDRAGELERTWEDAWGRLELKDNLPSTAFNMCMPDTGPAIFINSTEIETGRRAIFSNVHINSRYFTSAVDLQNSINQNIRYSSAMLLSARFPFISPAAMVQYSNGERRHYVDGGYYENKGNMTTLEVVNAIRYSCDPAYQKRIRPIVLMITNEDTQNKTIKGQQWFNELTEPPVAFMNVRSGHTERADSILAATMRAPRMNGKLYRLNMPLSGKVVPMNWFISAQAKREVKRFMDTSSTINQTVQEISSMLKKKNTPLYVARTL